MKKKIIGRKLRKRRGLKFKKRQFNKKINNKNKIFIIIFLSIIYIFLIYLENKKYLTLKLINYNKLKNITKNNIKYKGLERRLLYISISYS